MVLTAVEQHEPPGRRLVDDDLAGGFLPAPARLLTAATRSSVLRRLLVDTMERSGPGLWANLTCRKRYIGDKLHEALDSIDAVVILGAGLDTSAYRLARHSRIPVFEVDLPVNIARKAAACAGCSASRHDQFGWWRWISSATTCSRHWPNTATGRTIACSSSGKG
ncbi:methyltransferase, TIGR00027 family protein [Mycobacterium xenopi 4042]|uniref:S-adenosyl-L-methionine-dependent methyltransferase n=1 Tax=Mycobacterium xenopi 4042 TaxID=1299334 RepID=X8CHR3_MYCXE|nr:methyltransferase, TIGR00027 family protein [Mycobacterium xenopi 4042]